MCGICGIVNYRSAEPVDRAVIRQMTSAMIHRGPDGDGYFVSGHVGLGMRRLSIIDVEGGTQPMRSEDASVVTIFNGEIYNFIDTQSELRTRGHIFRTRADTEVIPHAYEEWGLDAFSRFNGMFAIAVWDESRRQMIVARDPYGIKPLYFIDDGFRIVFASEIRALLQAPSVPRRIDLSGLSQYLTLGYVPSPKTMFSEIRKLPAGHLLMVDDRGVRVRRFSRGAADVAELSESEAVAEARTLIWAAVRRQIVADVPVGAMLSGGVDSAAVVSVMSRLTPHRVRTFTAGFAGAPQAVDELAYARRTAAALGTIHREVLLRPEDVLGLLPDVVVALEEPISTPSAVAFHRVCQVAAEDVKVVLTGQGADEPFAGYARYLGEYLGQYYRLLPSPLQRLTRRGVEALPRNERAKRGVRALAISDDLSRFAEMYSVLDPEVKRALLTTCLPEGDFLPVIQDWRQEVAHRRPLDQMLYVDARMGLADNLLVYGDKVSMASSLEVRVPFLDHDLMSFAESLPSSLKMRWGTRKRILKRAVGEWVPPEVLSRRKVGFTVPIDEWFRNVLFEPLRESLLQADGGTSQYFDRNTVTRLLTEHRSGRHDHKRLLFALWSFAVWHREFLGAQPQLPTAA